MAEQVFSYVDYINKNPLYLHNHKYNFEETVGQIPKINYKSWADRYIKYLYKEEDKIIKALGGGLKGKDALKLFAEQVFESNDNIKHTASFIQDLFGQSGLGTVYIRGGKGDNIPTETIDFIYSDDKIEQVRYKQNLFLKIPGARLHYFVKQRKKSGGHGRPSNIYDFKRTLEEASEQELQEFKEALDIYVKSINDAFDKHNEILNNLQSFINLNSLKSKDESLGIIDTLNTYMTKMKQYDGTITEQWLEFLVSIEGMFNAIKGKFNEASATKFRELAVETFGEGFKAWRADTQTQGKFKKPDMIYAGGKLNLRLNPITVSMKQAVGSSIKAQESSLLNKENNNEDGIIASIKKESELIGNILLYLSLNNAYYPYAPAETIIKEIYKYLIYVFLSGNTKDARIDQAVFFVETKGVGKNIEVKFLSMADILVNIFNSTGYPISKMLYSKRNKEQFENLLFKKQQLYDESIDKHIDINYNLYNNEEIKNLIKNIAGNEVLYKKFRIGVNEKYLHSPGIIYNG